MQITGIVCEYNPFHLGHSYQLEAARRAANEDCAVVCVMSGNFVQRGEPAVLPKAARAEMAVRCGADLVAELPLPWALSSAERFADGGVALLEALGADNLAFGAECPDVSRLKALAEALLREETGALIREKLRDGVSYAAARERALWELVGPDAALLREPNNILAVEYIKAALRRGAALRFTAVERFGALHDGPVKAGAASAAAIRKLLLAGDDPAPFLPEAAAEILRREIAAGRGPVTVEAAEGAMLARFRTMTEADFAALPDGSEGLWRRFMEAARSEPTLEAVLVKAKTKRYALSRLRRMAMAAYLGLTADARPDDPPYIRVLAVGARGREILRRAKFRGTLPVLTKPAAVRRLSPEAQSLFALESRAADLYALLYPSPAQRQGGSEWRTGPVVV